MHLSTRGVTIMTSMTTVTGHIHSMNITTVDPTIRMTLDTLISGK